MNSFVPLLGAFAMTVATGPLATVSLSGAVSKPGEIEVTKPTRLKALIKEHGGLRADADPKKIEIRSADGTVRKIDFTRFDQNDVLKAGDAVVVPVLNEKDYVFVSGGVANKGAIDYKPGMDIVSVLNRAGLPNEKVKKQVVLVRDGKAQQVDVTKIEAGLQANIALMPADKVMVPSARAYQMSDRDLLTIVVIGLLVLVLIAD